MKILLIPDKFKDSLVAEDVIKSLKKGILRFNKNYKIESNLISDGGDGFLNAIEYQKKIDKIAVESIDPLGRKIDSYYLFNHDNKEAYIELANCSGLVLLKDIERDPLNTSTFGTGLQIKSAIELGAKKVYVGLGGSATNDGGIGIANALGYQFLDKCLENLKPVGKNLNKIYKIKEPIDPVFNNVKFYTVNDVENPLFGINGASYVFAKQKGATDDGIRILDSGLQNLNSQVHKYLKKDAAFIKGSGAAGGAAYGLKAFINAKFIKGIDFMLKFTGVIDNMHNNHLDLIITGEGKIDDQTIFGKLVQGVASKAKLYNIPVLAICGENSLKEYSKTDLSLIDIIEIADDNKSLAYNMKHASSLIEESIFNYFNEKF